MKRVIIQTKPRGTFQPSDEAMRLWATARNTNAESVPKHEQTFVRATTRPRDVEAARFDDALIDIVLKLKERADTPVSALKVITPNTDKDVRVIKNADGTEFVEEVHKTWA